MEDDGTQSYLVFQPIQKYFKRIDSGSNANHVCYWKSKVLPHKKFDFIKTTDYWLTP